MKQLTKEQAIAIYESGEWKDWTDDEIFRFQMWQECLAVPFDHFQLAADKVLGRPVWTHEFAYPELLKAEYLKERQPPTFEEIASLVPNAILVMTDEA